MGGHKKNKRGKKSSHRDETASKKAKPSASSSQPSAAWPQMMMPPQQQMMAGMMPQPWQMPQHMMLPQQLMQQQHMQHIPQPHMMQLPPGAGLAAAPAAAADPPPPGAPGSSGEDDDDDSSGGESEGEESGDSESSVDRKRGRHGKQKYQKDAKATITRSAAGLVQLPRVRLAELVEALAGLDSSVTAEWGERVSCKLIWVLTRVKPSTKISDLRVDSYSKLSSLLQRAHSRILQSLGAAKYDDKIKTVLGHSPSVDVVEALAAELGFNEAWFDKKVAAPKAKVAAAARPHQGVAFASPDTTAAAAAARAGPGHGRVERRLPPPPSFLQLPAPAAGPALAAPAPAARAPEAPAQPSSSAAPAFAPDPADPPAAAAGLSADDMQQALSMWAQHRRDQQHLPPPPERAAEPEQPLPHDASVDGADPQQEPAICCICQHGMGPGAGSLSGVVEALACAHLFHSACLDSYCQATGRSRLNCCPYKCNAEAFVVVEEQEVVPNAAAEDVEAAAEDLQALADDEMERARANMF